MIHNILESCFSIECFSILQPSQSYCRNLVGCTHGGQLLSCFPPEAQARARLAVFAMRAHFPLAKYSNMAAFPDQVLAALSALKLGSSGDDTERSEKFWNAATVAMKFSVEKLWLDAVWKCEEKPNFGMRSLNAILEERASNKFELTGPLIDGYLRELRKAIFSFWKVEKHWPNATS